MIDKKYFEAICANCGGRRGLHQNTNQRCPMNIDASPDHTSYRDTVFAPLAPEQILIDALRDIDLYDDVADPPFTPKQFGNIARKALKEYQQAKTSIPGETPIDRESEGKAIMEEVEKIRVQSGVYIWAFPITYRDDSGKVEKITFGWEIEWPSGQTHFYNTECETYFQALNEGIKAYQ